MRIYLAGPMRGLPNNNAEAFARDAAYLRSLGHEVWSPAEHDEALAVDAESFDVRRTFVRDLTQVLASDGVALMQGWEFSDGACLERHAADVCGVPVFLIVPGIDGGLFPLRPHTWRLATRRAPSAR